MKKQIALIVSGFAALLFNSSTFASSVPIDGTYRVTCKPSVSDGGTLRVRGEIQIAAGKVTARPRVVMNVTSDQIDSPEAERHILPAVALEGTAVIDNGPLTPVNGRPARMELHLIATNSSVKDRIKAFTLIDNNAPSGGDQEISRIEFDGQTYSGVCSITP